MTIAWAAIVVLTTAIAQVLLRTGAKVHGGEPIVRQYLNTPVISGYALLFGVTLVNVEVLARVRFYVAGALYATTQIAVLVAARVVLGERFDRRTSVGTVFIVAGVVLVAFGAGYG